MTTYITDELQKWMRENEPGKDYNYHAQYWEQTVFVRDRLTGLLFGSRDAQRGHIRVIGTHTSKSIKLPVYEFELPDWGLRLTLRHNFYDWKVSVESRHNITLDFGELFNKETVWTYHHCDGFPHDRIFLPYQMNNRAFTVELSTILELHTFFWLLLNYLKVEENAIRCELCGRKTAYPYSDMRLDTHLHGLGQHLCERDAILVNRLSNEAALAVLEDGEKRREKGKYLLAE